MRGIFLLPGFHPFASHFAFVVRCKENSLDQIELQGDQSFCRFKGGSSDLDSDESAIAGVEVVAGGVTACPEMKKVLSTVHYDLISFDSVTEGGYEDVLEGSMGAGAARESAGRAL